MSQPNEDGFVADQAGGDSDGFVADNGDDGFVADAPTPRPGDIKNKASIWGGTQVGASALLKLLNSGGNLVGTPLRNLYVKGRTGKDVSNPQEYADAVNPTTWATPKNTDQKLEQAGMPRGALYSDTHASPMEAFSGMKFPAKALALASAIPALQYKEPNKNNSWYDMEKGGAFDSSPRGREGFAVDMATDPLNYLGIGEAATGAKALARNGTVKALAGESGPVMKGLQSIGNAASVPFEAASNAVSKIPVAKYFNKIATAPSDLFHSFANANYAAPMTAVEDAGRIRGKTEVAQQMHNLGISNPLQLQDVKSKIQNILNPNVKARLAQAAADGAKLDPESIFQPTLEKIQNIQNKPHLNAVVGGDTVDTTGTIEKLKEITRGKPGVPGTPATPATTHVASSPILDEWGQPIQKQVVVPGSPATPGTPATPGVPLDPQVATEVKSALNGKIPLEARKTSTVNTPLDTRLNMSMQSDLQHGVPDAVAAVHGPQAAKELNDINETMGTGLSTMKGGNTAASLFNRQLKNSTTLSRTNSIIGALTQAHGGLAESLKTLGLKMGWDAAGLTRMPVGYYGKHIAQNRVAAPLLDAAARHKMAAWMQLQAQPGTNNQNQGELPNE